VDWGSPQARGLVGFWPMNEGVGTTLKDWSRGNNDCNTASGHGPYASAVSPVWVTETNGPANYFGYYYVQNLTVNNPYTTFDSVLQDYTFSLWFNNIGGVKSQAGYDKLLQKNISNIALIRNNLNSNQWIAYVDGAFSAGYLTLKDGIPHHFVCIRKGATLYLIGDGGQQISSGACSTAPTDTTVLSFGGEPTNSQQNFVGAMWDVRVYNRALSMSEVMDLYGNPNRIWQNQAAIILKGVPSSGATPGICIIT
jgi:hypothetical protein